jgi:hypothetical protein
MAFVIRKLKEKFMTRFQLSCIQNPGRPNLLYNKLVAEVGYER